MHFKLFFSFCSLVLLLLSEAAFGWKMEADKVTVNNTTGNVVTHVNFRQTYDSIPLVFSLATHNGSDPSTLRITNISTTGFDVYSVEAEGSDGVHAQMSAVPYIAIEAGNHVLPDGTKISAGSIATKQFQSKLIAGGGWQGVSLTGFTTTPVVLGQIQTRTNERTDLTVPSAVSQPWMTTAIRNITSSGFSMALERSETTSGSLTSNETVAYLAIDSALNGGNHYFASNDAKKIEYESIRSSSSIGGWDNSVTGYVVNFSKSYSNPIAVSTKSTRNGTDGGWLRRKSISVNNIALVVDEDIAADAERAHIAEVASMLVFSRPFDSEFIYSGQAEVIINEVLYNESVTGNNNDEFVELYVMSAGNMKGTIITDQDTNYYVLPSKTVALGDYVIFHVGNGTNNSAGNVHHFYKGASTMWNNGNDDVVILKPAQDVTTLADNTIFNAIPFDYMAYGRNSVGSNVDVIPSSVAGATLSWDYSKGTELKFAVDGESISLTPNALDSDRARCWERTTSGNAGNNGCVGYLITRDTNPSAFINSLGTSNTDSPIINLAKTTLTIYDPFNGASNPKAIPGAILEYIINAKNEGSLAADNNSIVLSDGIPTNTKVCVTTSGGCKAPYFINGPINSGLSLAGVSYSDDGGVSYSYTPSPDAEGADANVTHIRAAMNGAFLPKAGANVPSFQLRFRVVVE